MPMESDSQWLSDVVLVNESRAEATAGDVSLYRSTGEACRFLEHWWVKDSEGYAFSAAGDRLILGVDQSNNVIVMRREPCAEGKSIVLNWLNSCAVAVLQARRSRAAKGKDILGLYEEQGHLPQTVEGLIGYIGFSR
jgi:hypothetical protein